MQWNRTSSFEFDGKSMGTEITTQSEFPNAGKAIVQQIQPLHLWCSESVGTEKIYGTVNTTTTGYVLVDFEDGGNCRVLKNMSTKLVSETVGIQHMPKIRLVKLKPK